MGWPLADELFIHWNTGQLGADASQQEGLVEATQALARWMERNGEQDIGLQLKALIGLDQQSTQIFSQACLAIIFQRFDAGAQWIGVGAEGINVVHVSSRWVEQTGVRAASLCAEWAGRLRWQGLGLKPGLAVWAEDVSRALAGGATRREKQIQPLSPKSF